MEDNKQFNKKPRIPLNPPKSQCSWMKTKWTNINAQKIQYLNPHYQFERRSRCPIDPDDEFSQCKLPNIKRYLKESKGVRAEELFDLRVLREDLSSARGMRLICVWPEKICTHYTLFFSTLFPAVPHFSPLSLSLSLFRPRSLPLSPLFSHYKLFMCFLLPPQRYSWSCGDGGIVKMKMGILSFITLLDLQDVSESGPNMMDSLG